MSCAENNRFCVASKGENAAKIAGIGYCSFYNIFVSFLISFISVFIKRELAFKIAVIFPFFNVLKKLKETFNIGTTPLSLPSKLHSSVSWKLNLSAKNLYLT